MVFTEEDKHVITFLRKNKRYGAKRLLREFPHKLWTRGGLNALILKIDRTGSCQRLPGSGRPRTARTIENVEQVEQLLLKQEDKPSLLRSQRKISQKTGISHSTVRRIIKSDLGLQCLKKKRPQELAETTKQTRFQRCKELLKLYPENLVSFIWFTDVKLFTTSAPNYSQNDNIYVSVETRKKEKRLSKNHNNSVVVAVGVSLLGRTAVHFVQPDVKVKGQYYRDVLAHNLLPDIRKTSDYFIFQQSGAPSHKSRDTIDFLQKETYAFIPPTMWPPSSPDLNPLEYKIWGVVQEKVYRVKIRDANHLRQRIEKTWYEIDQVVIDEAIKQWRTRLSLCVEMKGKQFEHKHKALARRDIVEENGDQMKNMVNLSEDLCQHNFVPSVEEQRVLDRPPEVLSPEVLPHPPVSQSVNADFCTTLGWSSDLINQY